MRPDPDDRRTRGRRPSERQGALSRKPGALREPPRRRSREPVPEEEPGKGFPKQYVAPIAVIIGIILVGAIVLVIVVNSNSSIERIFVGNIETKDMDDAVYNDLFRETLYVPLIADAKGFSSAEGEATLEVTFGSDPAVIYSEKVEISEDFGYTYIHMNKFVIGNGKYTFTAKADGVEGSQDFSVYWVTEKLTAAWTETNEDVAFSSHSYTVKYTVTPQDKDGHNLMMAPMPYTLRGTLSKPEGGDGSIKVDWPSTSSYIISSTTEHIMKGTYTLDLEWTNLMCVSTSPYYKVGLTENDELDVDSPPYASAGDDQTVGLSGGSAEVSLDGSGSFDDGDITEYQWDFGDNTTAVTTTPHTMHVYHAAGEYYVSLIVKDDSGQDSKGRWSDSTVVTVNG